MENVKSGSCRLMEPTEGLTAWWLRLLHTLTKLRALGQQWPPAASGVQDLVLFVFTHDKTCLFFSDFFFFLPDICFGVRTCYILILIQSCLLCVSLVWWRIFCVFKRKKKTCLFTRCIHLFCSHPKLVGFNFFFLYKILLNTGWFKF